MNVSCHGASPRRNSCVNLSSKAKIEKETQWPDCVAVVIPHSLAREVDVVIHR